MSSGYVIADDPRPGKLAHLSVSPMWPFFAVMFAGAWLAWPWYVLNSFAIGSPNQKREIALVVTGFSTAASADTEANATVVVVVSDDIMDRTTDIACPGDGEAGGGNDNNL